MRQTNIPAVDTRPPNICNSGRKPWEEGEMRMKAFKRRRRYKIIEVYLQMKQEGRV